MPCSYRLRESLWLAVDECDHELDFTVNGQFANDSVVAADLAGASDDCGLPVNGGLTIPRDGVAAEEPTGSAEHVELTRPGTGDRRPVERVVCLGPSYLVEFHDIVQVRGPSEEFGSVGGYELCAGTSAASARSSAFTATNIWSLSWSAL